MRVSGDEEQSHGFQFEQRVWNHLFQRGYTDEWDIPGAANLVNPGVPISVKCIKWKNSIYLGDAIAQRRIDHPFEMIVGFYREIPDSGELRVVALHRLMIEPEDWDRWWGGVTVEALEALDRRVGSGELSETQAFARKEAARLRSLSPVMSINPKVNKDQRRIQCSIPFTVFYRDVLGKEPVEEEVIELWGREFPAELDSGRRVKD